MSVDVGSKVANRFLTDGFAFKMGLLIGRQVEWGFHIHEATPLQVFIFPFNLIDSVPVCPNGFLICFEKN